MNPHTVAINGKMMNFERDELVIPVVLRCNEIYGKLKAGFVQFLMRRLPSDLPSIRILEGLISAGSELFTRIEALARRRKIGAARWRDMNRFVEIRWNSGR
jgi:hypothetical protein